MRQPVVNLAAFSLCLIAVTAAHASGPPMQGVLTVSQDNRWLLTVQQSVAKQRDESYEITGYVEKEVVREQIVDGKKVAVVEKKLVPVPQTATRKVIYREYVNNCQALDPATINAFETDGRSISQAMLGKRLSDGLLIVVAEGPEMISDAYARLFKPGTVILARSIPAGQPIVSFPVPASVRFPASPAPEWVFVRQGEDGLIQIRQLEEVQQQVDLTIRSNDSSVAQESMHKASHLVRRSRTTSLPGRLLRVSTPEGGDLSAEQVAADLGSRETAAVLSRDGASVDDFWLQNLQADALVIRGVVLPDLSSTLATKPVVPMPAPALEMSAPPPPAQPSVQSVPVQPIVPPAGTNELSALERELFELTNAERKRAGLAPYRISPQLMQAARQHAENMARKQVLEHTIDDESFDQRIKKTGYDLASAGENISDATSAAEAVARWLDSQGHRENLLNATYEDLGVGAGTSASGRKFWTQVFAKAAGR